MPPARKAKARAVLALARDENAAPQKRTQPKLRAGKSNDLSSSSTNSSGSRLTDNTATSSSEKKQRQTRGARPARKAVADETASAETWIAAVRGAATLHELSEVLETSRAPPASSLPRSSLVEALEHCEKVIESQSTDAGLPEGGGDTTVVLVQVLTSLLDAYQSQTAPDTSLARDAPPAVLALGRRLRDASLTIPSDLKLLRRCVGSLEFLCSIDGQNENLFVGAYLLTLLHACSCVDGSSSDIQRLHKARQSLLLVDFDDFGSTKCLKSRLFQCFTNNTFLHNETGIRFLSYAVGSLHPGLSVELISWCKAIAAASSAGTRTAASLASVLYGAWKASASSTSIRAAIENALEDVVESALLCRSKVASKMREMLAKFCQKGDADTTDLACRIMLPPIHKCLPVACWRVRFNAVALFSVAFPLLDVNLPSGEYEAEIERQYSTLVKLTEDSHPEVRRVAIKGVCRVLVTFWEMIPTEKAILMLDTLLHKAVRDRSSTLIRASVIEGLQHVLMNPMSHAALTTLLPKVAAYVDDSAPAVRKAAANLLKQMSTMEGFDLSTMIPLERLLTRLVKDKIISDMQHCHEGLMDSGRTTHKGDYHETADAIGHLMFHSTLGSEDLPTQVQRVLYTAETYPAALLSLTSITACKLTRVDRLRLAVSLVNWVARQVAALPVVASSPADSEKDEQNARRFRKRQRVASAVLYTAALLLRGVKDPLVAKKGAARGGKSRAADDEVVDFLEKNFSAVVLEPLLGVDSPVFDAASELVLSLVENGAGSLALETLHTASLKGLETALKGGEEIPGLMRDGFVSLLSTVWGVMSRRSENSGSELRFTSTLVESLIIPSITLATNHLKAEIMRVPEEEAGGNGAVPPPSKRIRRGKRTKRSPPVKATHRAALEAASVAASCLESVFLQNAEVMKGAALQLTKADCKALEECILDAGFGTLDAIGNAPPASLVQSGEFAGEDAGCSVLLDTSLRRLAPLAVQTALQCAALDGDTFSGFAARIKEYWEDNSAWLSRVADTLSTWRHAGEAFTSTWLALRETYSLMFRSFAVAVSLDVVKVQIDSTELTRLFREILHPLPTSSPPLATSERSDGIRPWYTRCLGALLLMADTDKLTVVQFYEALEALLFAAPSPVTRSKGFVQEVTRRLTQSRIVRRQRAIAAAGATTTEEEAARGPSFSAQTFISNQRVKIGDNMEKDQHAFVEGVLSELARFWRLPTPEQEAASLNDEPTEAGGEVADEALMAESPPLDGQGTEPAS